MAKKARERVMDPPMVWSWRGWFTATLGRPRPRTQPDARTALEVWPLGQSRLAGSGYAVEGGRAEERSTRASHSATRARSSSGCSCGRACPASSTTASEACGWWSTRSEAAAYPTVESQPPGHDQGRTGVGRPGAGRAPTARRSVPSPPRRRARRRERRSVRTARASRGSAPRSSSRKSSSPRSPDPTTTRCSGTSRSPAATDRPAPGRPPAAASSPPSPARSRRPPSAPPAGTAPRRRPRRRSRATCRGRPRRCAASQARPCDPSPGGRGRSAGNPTPPAKAGSKQASDSWWSTPAPCSTSTGRPAPCST